MTPTFISLVAIAWLSPAPSTFSTVEMRFVGPGYYCGGGFLVRLEKGEQVTFTSQRIDTATISLDLAGRRVEATSSPVAPRGKRVQKIAEGILRQSSENGRIFYVVDDQQPILLSITSPAFRGFTKDKWFFDRINFDPTAEKAVTCLAQQK
ncbi:hypothetical protein IC614_05485 [Allosphingosinicella flava]|uniref:Uncharacterized protein n=1 Tax=Allosphingosinicella flava TaxID=2771430 RepID=A0A7T2GLF6_9SPHN|nr:hypothetical protein [Sphingosinicella flava]QPQ56029.1 hypothetical protein IC614_05485 [Sphingosinicella flava]